LERELANSKIELEKLKSLTPNNSESVLKSLQQNRNNIDNKKVIEYLSKKKGVDYLKQLENIRIREAFEKTNRNGSTNTNLGAFVGGGIGSAAGGLIGGPIGFGIGGGLGASIGAPIGTAILDKYAGRAFKGVLDAKIMVDKGLPWASMTFGKFASPLFEAAQRGNS